MKHDDGYLTPERSPIFHYALFGHYMSPLDDVGHRGESSNDSSDVVQFHTGADSFVVTLGNYRGWNLDMQQGITFAHELGHNLGLMHGGDEDLNYKPNYLSIMNYAYAQEGLIWSGSAQLIEYSLAALPDLPRGCSQRAGRPESRDDHRPVRRHVALPGNAPSGQRDHRQRPHRLELQWYDRRHHGHHRRKPGPGSDKSARLRRLARGGVQRWAHRKAGRPLDTPRARRQIGPAEWDPRRAGC